MNTSYKSIMGKYDFDLDIYGNNTIALIAEKVPEGSRVLEFGPANGRLTRYLKESKKCEVDIIEIDEEAGKEAARYAVNSFIGEEKGDIEKYYWIQTDAKYDIMIFADVLEHLVWPDRVLSRCKKLIKDGGMILVSIPNISHNSVIIALMNDEFKYNPTGILDNTHLRFFTRSSFLKMALDAGWAVTEERVKNIRVGETEIKNSYNDVPNEVRKVLRHRVEGNVYQYFFTLKLSDEYLMGKSERIVSIDSTSFYFIEVLFRHEGVFDYTKSITRYYDPYMGKLHVNFDILQSEDCQVCIKPINCSCVLDDLHIIVKTNNTDFEIKDYEYNGVRLGHRLYFVDMIPEIKASIPNGASKLSIDTKILKYDFTDEVLSDILNKYEGEQQRFIQIRDEYNAEIKRKEMEILDNLQKYKEESENRERVISDSIKKYEAEINLREDERVKLIQEYEDKIKKLKKEQLEVIRDYELRLENNTSFIKRCLRKK